jgi:hypothetical protein
MDKRDLGAVAPDSLEHVERAPRVGVEVIEGNLGGFVVTGLSRGVDDGIRTNNADQL